MRLIIDPNTRQKGVGVVIKVLVICVCLTFIIIAMCFVLFVYVGHSKLVTFVCFFFVGWSLWLVFIDLIPRYADQRKQNMPFFLFFFCLFNFGERHDDFNDGVCFILLYYYYIVLLLYYYYYCYFWYLNWKCLLREVFVFYSILFLFDFLQVP